MVSGLCIKRGFLYLLLRNTNPISFVCKKQKQNRARQSFGEISRFPINPHGTFFG